MENPREKICRGHIAEEWVVLHQRYRINRNKELVFFLRVRCYSSEGVGQHCDQNGHYQKMANNQESREKEFSQEIIVRPRIPRSRGETEQYLKEMVPEIC